MKREGLTPDVVAYSTLIQVSVDKEESVSHPTFLSYLDNLFYFAVTNIAPGISKSGRMEQSVGSLSAHGEGRCSTQRDRLHRSDRCMCQGRGVEKVESMRLAAGDGAAGRWGSWRG